MGKTEEEIAEQLGTIAVSENGQLQEMPPKDDQQNGEKSESDSELQSE